LGDVETKVMARKKSGTLETAADKAGDLLARAVSAPLDMAAAALDGVAEALAKKATGAKGTTRPSEAEPPKERAKRAPAKRAAAPKKKRAAAPKKTPAAALKKKSAAAPKTSTAKRKGKASSTGRMKKAGASRKSRGRG
jgi:septal ring-binding cell division protein DamX